MSLSILALALTGFQEPEYRKVSLASDLLKIRSWTVLQSETKRYVELAINGKEEQNAQAAFFGSLLWSSGLRRRIIKSNQGALFSKLSELGGRDFKKPETRLLQGWWLQSVASKEIFRADAPSRSVDKLVKMPNGKSYPVTEMHYDKIDVRVTLGKNLVEKALAELSNDLWACYYRAVTEKNYPIKGDFGARFCFDKFPVPFKWNFQKILILRDAAGPNANAILANWRAINESKEIPVGLQLLTKE